MLIKYKKSYKIDNIKELSKYLIPIKEIQSLSFNNKISKKYLNDSYVSFINYDRKKPRLSLINKTNFKKFKEYFEDYIILKNEYEIENDQVSFENLEALITTLYSLIEYSYQISSPEYSEIKNLGHTALENIIY